MRVGQFSSELLRGPEHLNANQRRELSAFFAAVADRRGFPLHTAVLWNTLYFGYDLDAHEYLGRGVRLEPADDGRPIPVGAFVDVPPKQTPLYGEVIYKEGRDGDASPDTGLVDAIVSGGRGGRNATGQAVSVGEALILDFNAFGSDFHDYGEVEFKRFVRKGWLDEHHHRVVNAVYQPDEAADDLSVYARYLHDAYGDDLFAEFLVGGERLSDEDLRDLLLRSFETVHQIAKECSDLVRIGDYHIARSTVARATTASDDAPLSGNDLRAMVRRVGDLSGRVRCGYTAVGPMVLAHLANQGFTDEEKLMVRGPGYANLVCALNAGLAECVGDSGLLDGDRHLRLDDDWNWGGIWRVERYDDKPPDHSRFHPLMPLGLGYASTTSNGATVAQPPPSEPLIEIADRHWTVTLRKLDIDCGDLPLSPAAIPQLPQEARIVMELSVVGEKSYGRTARPIDRERRMLRDIDYPPEFFPGVILRCSLGMGNRVVMVQAHPLTIPVTVEEMTLTLEHDPEVFKRDLGLVPIDRKVFRGTRTLADQVAMVFRLHGRVTEDGGRALTAEEVLGRLLGADIHPETAQAVLIALTGMDLDFDDGVYTWRPRLTRRTSARERVKIQAARSSASGRRLTRRIAPRTVAMHLRHYVKRQPSTGKVNSYVQALIDNKAAHRLPSELPPGYSWVKPYPVGPRGGE